MISRTSMSELLRTQCQLTQTNAMPTMASHCTVAAPHSTETGPPPSVALQRYLPHQRRPLRGSREQGQGPSVGLSTLAQVVQPALHRVGRHTDPIVGNLDLNRRVTPDEHTGARRASMSGDIGQALSN